MVGLLRFGLPGAAAAGAKESAASSVGVRPAEGGRVAQRLDETGRGRAQRENAPDSAGSGMSSRSDDVVTTVIGIVLESLPGSILLCLRVVSASCSYFCY